jgi:molybdate transport system substrate-binding protein
MKLLAAVAASAAILVHGACEAAEIRLMSSVGVRPVLEELLPQFERASGHTVAVQFGTAAQMKAKIDAGEPFDVAIIGVAQVDDVVKQGKGAADSRIGIARTGMGFAIREAAPRPDLGTDDKLRAYLQGVKSIASGNPASGGFGSVYFDRLVQRLGIGEEARAKTKHSPPGEFAKPVASGEAEVGAGLVSEIVSVKGVQAVPLMPQDPSSYLGFAGVAASATDRDSAARALLRFLASPAAREVFTAKGMPPE